MRIIDTQRRLHEAGRIRIGAQVQGTRDDGSTYTRPSKLETFRFTSSNRAALEAIAALYEGDVHPWQDAPTSGQFELFTEASVIKVLLPPEHMSYSTSYEIWTGGGCTVRCNGVWDYKNEQDCSCDPDSRLCKPHTRLSVMLEGLPGAGLWRLETQGQNALEEIGGAFDLAGIIIDQVRSSILPATLRLDQRKSVVDGKTKQFVVPVLDFDIDMAALSRGGLTPVIALNEAPLSLSDQFAALDEGGAPSTRKNAALPVTPTGLKPHALEPGRADNNPDVERIIANEHEHHSLDDMMGHLDESGLATLAEMWEAARIPPKRLGLTQAEIEKIIGWVMHLLDEGHARDDGEAADSPGEAVDAETGEVIPTDQPEGDTGQRGPSQADNDADIQRRLENRGLPTGAPKFDETNESHNDSRGTSATPTTKITKTAIGSIFGKCRRLGIIAILTENDGVEMKDNSPIHRYVEKFVGRDDVNSLSDLTKAEGAKILMELDEQLSQR